MRVLLAEDDDLLASVVAEALSDEGHAVSHVSTAEALVERSGTESWDVIVLDAFGASHDDVDEPTRATLRLLTSRAPVVLATGRAWAAYVTAEQLGIAAVLPKPYDLDRLCEAVMRAAASRAVRTS